MTSSFKTLLRALGFCLLVMLALSTWHAYTSGGFSEDSALTRGDFPAFYALASIAAGPDPSALYSLAEQARVQGEAWPSMKGSVLPAAYPPYVALLLKPLAHLSPAAARAAWIVLSLALLVASGVLLAGASRFLEHHSVEVVILLSLFPPLFAGVIGCQTVIFSCFCYAVILAASRRSSPTADCIAGMACALWMFKPHFALAALATLCAQRRWRALSTFLPICGVCYLLGARVLGFSWPLLWSSFAREFSAIDLATNSYQMPGLVALAYPYMPASLLWPSEVASLCLLVAATVFTQHTVRHAAGAHLLGFLPLGALIALLAPAVNFYDLGVAVVPLLILFNPGRRAHLQGALAVFALGVCTLELPAQNFPGVACAVAILLLSLLACALRASPATQ